MYKKWSALLKAKIAIEAIKQEKTINEISIETGAHPNMISKWRNRLLENADLIFSSSINEHSKSLDPKKDDLYKQIGFLYSENYYLKNKEL